jgi:hypothetical protein
VQESSTHRSSARQSLILCFLYHLTQHYSRYFWAGEIPILPWENVISLVIVPVVHFCIYSPILATHLFFLYWKNHSQRLQWLQILKLHGTFYKPGGDRVHVCAMGLKWGHTGVVHVAAPVGFWEKMPLLAKKS